MYGLNHNDIMWIASKRIVASFRDLKATLEDYIEFHIEGICEDLFDDYAVIIDKFTSDRVQSKI